LPVEYKKGRLPGNLPFLYSTGKSENGLATIGIEEVDTLAVNVEPDFVPSGCTGVRAERGSNALATRCQVYL
jgi:hypothetical protein